MKMYEHITTSDHIRFAPFTHAAFEKGDLVTIGALHGIADIGSDANDAVAIDCGTPRAVFRVAFNDITGSPAVGASLYINAGVLTTTASGGVYGVVTLVDADIVEFVVMGV